MKKILLVMMAIFAFGFQSVIAQDAIKIVTNHPDFKIKVKRCAASGSTVIIDLTLTNEGTNDVTDVCGFGGYRDIDFERSEAYDDEGNIYEDRSLKVKVANRKDYSFSSGSFNIPVGVPVKYSVYIENFSQSAESIARLALKFRCDAWGINEYKPVMISNIPITRN